MGTDRELLERAAKAAGIKWMAMDNWPHEDKCRYWSDGETCDCGAAWNPLTDDGDALRLAVALQIDIKQYGDHVVAWFDGGFIGTGRIPYDGDPYAATRRAIVRAAAAMPEGGQG